MNDLLKLTFSGIALFTILIIQQSFVETYFDKSLEFIPKLQADVSDFKEGAWLAYTHIGLALETTLPIVIPYLFISQRARCFYYVFVIFGIDAVTSVAKLNYHQQRPYWVAENIQAFDCSNQYGNPSGHCFTTGGTLLAIWLDYN